MNARIAPPPIWPGPKTLNGCTVTVGSSELVVVGVRHVLARELRDGVGPARLADRADRRHLALLDAKGVRAEDLARREVDEALERRLGRERGLERVVRADHVDAHRAHRALEHRVDAGDRGAVDEVRRAARRVDTARRRRGCRPGQLEVRVVGEVVPDSASRCRLSNATTVFRSTSSRASVVPMKPAPPVMKTRFPVECHGGTGIVDARATARRPPATLRRPGAAQRGRDQEHRADAQAARDHDPDAGVPEALEDRPDREPAERRRRARWRS